MVGQLDITGGELQNTLWRSHIAAFDVLEGDQTNASDEDETNATEKQLYLRLVSFSPCCAVIGPPTRTRHYNSTSYARYKLLPEEH